MIIETLNMTHFGRFHQQQLNLMPGINVVYGENEAGKTTIHQFIQAMLFGVERLRGRASKKDEYSRFQPWEQGRNYEGSVVIEHGGESYRIVRNFYKEDEYFRVEQLSTGKDILLPGEQLDGLIPGLTRANFKNGLSIGQMGSVIDARFGLSLQAYMANIKRTKSQEVDIGRTLDYLRKERKIQMDKSPEKRLQELEEQIGQLQVSEGEREKLCEDIRTQQETLSEIRRSQQAERNAGRENRIKEQKERMEAIRLIEENNYIASQYQQKKEAYENMKRQSLEEDFDSLKAQWDEANEAYDDLSDRYEQLMGRNLAILFSVMMFGLIPVIAVFFLRSGMGIRIGMVLFLVLLLMGTAFILQSGKRRMGRKVSASRKELEDIQTLMEGQMFGRSSRGVLKQMKEELKALRQQYEQLQEPLKPYIEKYGENISLDMDEDDQEREMEALRVREQNLTKSLERLLVQKEALDQREGERSILENELEELSKVIGDDREEVGIIDECMEIIQNLSEEIHSDFGPALNQEVSRIMWELTGGKYERVVVDNQLNLKVDTGTSFADAEQLSTGTREQLYLALRLSMVKLLFPEENMPIILDDSFVFYDDRRLTRTLAWLAQQNFPQIILFTCQHREMEGLDRLGINYTPIYLK